MRGSIELQYSEALGSSRAFCLQYELVVAFIDPSSDPIGQAQQESANGWSEKSRIQGIPGCGKADTLPTVLSQATRLGIQNPDSIPRHASPSYPL